MNFAMKFESNITKSWYNLQKVTENYGGKAMDKVLLLNAGSSSVKWKVFEIESEKVAGEGEIERINTPQALVTAKFNGEKKQSQEPNLGYEDAVRMILNKIEEFKIASLDEIQIVGHRVVAGGQKV